MTGEIPRPERVNPPFEQLFNVDAMSDDQIVVLNRGLWMVADEVIGDELFTREIDFFVHERLSDDIRDLVARDPGRVKQLVQRLTASEDWADQKLAAKVVPGLIGYDYVFVRDTLISIYAGDAHQRIRYDPHETDGTAYDEIRYLMRDHLTLDQIADFQACADRYEPDMPLYPARPDK